MNVPPISRAEFFLFTARAVLRSRVWRCFVALAILGASVGVAAICWQARELLGAAAAMFLVYFGLLFAWELLPFSEATRARWARLRALSEHSYAYSWRWALGFGLGMLALRLWAASARHTFEPREFFLPVICIIVGGVAETVWRRRVSRADGKRLGARPL